MRAPILLLAAAIALPAAAQRASVAPWVTGEQLLQKLQPVNPQDVPWTAASGASKEELAGLHTHANIEYVHGYLSALHDATEGKAWCYDDRHQVPNPEVFWDESRWGLARLSVAQRARSAAELLPVIWQAKWPCPTGDRRRP